MSKPTKMTRRETLMASMGMLGVAATGTVLAQRRRPGPIEVRRPLRVSEFWWPLASLRRGWKRITWSID